MRAWSRVFLLIAAVLISNSISAVAQEAAPTTAPISDSADPTAATTNPSSPSPENARITLNFKDASVDAVLEYFSQVFGLEVVKDAPFNGRVTLLSKHPISADEAVSLLNTAVSGKGFAVTRLGNVLKILPIDRVKKGSIPVYVGADPLQIARSDDLITQVIPVRNVDVVKLKQDLQPMVGADADLSANAGSNDLMITDTSANVRRVVQIVAALDERDPGETAMRVKKLKYADAVAAAKLILEIFRDDEPSPGFGGASAAPVPAPAAPAAPPAPRPGGPPPPPGAPQDQPEGPRQPRIIASADQRTNTVVVTGPPATLKIIDAMLSELDSSPEAEQAFFLYRVQNGQALEMAATLNSLFGAGTSGAATNADTGATARSRFAGGYGETSQVAGNFGGNAGGASSFGSTRLGGGTLFNMGNNFGGGPASRLPQNTLNVPPAVSSAAGELLGQAYVVPDADTNSLLVASASKYEQRVRDIIAELDRPVPQVLIKVLIAEVSHDDTTDLGLDFSVLNLRASGNGAKGGTSFGNAIATGGLVVNLLESNITATLHALAVNGKLDVLSRPYILTSDNQEASITVGQIVPFITESRLDINSNTINTVQYQDIGIILDVTPHINPEGIVTLDVAPQISSLTQTTVEISAGVNAPVFQLRSANSRVSIRDGQTIVIGGLMEDKNNQTLQKVPILGDIPGLGVLFQRNQVEKTKTELLIFLTPHVAKEPDRLLPMSQDEMRGTKLVPSAVQPGTFQDQIRGMERGGATTEPVSPGAKT